MSKDFTSYFFVNLLVLAQSSSLHSSGLQSDELFRDRLTECAHNLVDTIKRLCCYDMRYSFCHLKERVNVKSSRDILVEGIQLGDMVDQVLLLVAIESMPYLLAILTEVF
jgi:hypothetical protein